MPLTIFFPDAGTFTIEDDGIRGNNISVIRNSAGAIIFTFVHPSDQLTFATLTAGVNFIFNVADSFGTANVTVGSLTDAAQSPASIVVNYLQTNGTATLVSNGSITEYGTDVTADIVAPVLTLSAATGIGTAANALETQVTFIEGETNTGGINIANTGSVQIGGITANVEGLFVGDSGDINFSNVGGIFIADTSGAYMIHGGNNSGNVTLNAIGYDSDIYATINAKFISAAGGGVTLTAGRDVLVGIGGTNYDNDILATNFVTIHAGRDFQLDGTSNLRTGAFGGVVGGDIFIQAGRNISLTNTTGGLQTIEAFSGNITLMTGQNGTYLQNSAFSAAVQTTNDIFVVADVFLLNSGGLNTTGVGQIAIRPATAGRAIDIGSTIELTGALSLSDSELDRFFTLNVSIGDENSGNVNFSAPISPFIYNNFNVRSAGEILLQSSISMSGALTLRADRIYQLAASGITVDTFAAYVDAFDNDPGIGGVATFSGTLTTSSNMINGNADGDTLTGNGAANFIFGLGGDDILRGAGGNDSLDGGTGADRMDGGLGNDNFTVDNAGDFVIEANGEGTDIVYASVGYTLSPGAYIELLTTNSISGTNAIAMTGNELSNTIWGNNGANTLSGGVGGNDTLVGFLGDDTYLINNGNEVIVENNGEGTDIVYVNASYTLSANASIELLSTYSIAGTAPINLTGNNLSNTIWGNRGDNTLSGGIGGLDTLVGFLGNDTYLVNNGNEVISENVGEGSDMVFASVSYVLTAGASIELLSTNSIGGTGAINLTGNELANTLWGNGGANTLNGGLGADTLQGFGGADNFAFTTALFGGNVDIVSDFAVGVDKIQLDDAIFTSLALGALPAGAFRIGAAALDADDRIIYNPATGALIFDVDGIGGLSDVQFATLSTGLALTASDFAVI